MMYVKSIYTGEIYAVETMPKFGGYEVVSKAEYDEQVAKRGF